jgi:hypothetical protein
MLRRIVATVVVVLVLAAGGATVLGTGLDLARSRAEAAVYRQRLEDLADRHAGLVTRYNDAVRRTAITELLVREPVVAGEPPSLAIRVRTVEGVQREILTPFDPRAEIFVDFVVRDGRVLIRRIFDEWTPPSLALVVDGSLGTVDWEAEGVRLGKAVYRSLQPGRWTVSVSGSGALDLAWAGPIDAAPAVLAVTAAVEDFQELDSEVRDVRSAVGLGDLWRVIRGGPAIADAGEGH